MNKLIFVLLAVCLVSVHAFVKRDAPAAQPAQPDVAKDLQNQLQDLGKQLENLVNKDNIKHGVDDAVAKVKEVFDSEELKKQLNNVINTINNAVQNLGQTTAAPQKS